MSIEICIFESVGKMKCYGYWALIELNSEEVDSIC